MFSEGPSPLSEVCGLCLVLLRAGGPVRVALAKAEGSGLGSVLLFRKHKHEGLGHTSQTRGIRMNKVSESSHLLTHLHVCIVRVM